jgi:hypothetical protein
MTNADVRKYVKTQLGISWVDVEAENRDIDELIKMALDKLTPYYEGHRFVQASGSVIDLSNHHPLTIEKIYSVTSNQIASLQEYAFGGTGVVLFDSSLMDRIISYTSFKMLWNEIKYQKGQNYKLIKDTLYIDGYDGEVLIDMLVRPTVISDIEESSMYHSWVKEYVLALTKELLGRVRGKFVVDGSPYSLDSSQLLSEAQQEKANLESQLQGEIFCI